MIKFLLLALFLGGAASTMGTAIDDNNCHLYIVWPINQGVQAICYGNCDQDDPEGLYVECEVHSWTNQTGLTFYRCKCGLDLDPIARTECYEEVWIGMITIWPKCTNISCGTSCKPPELPPGWLFPGMPPVPACMCQ